MINKSVLIGIQARSTSSRLPNKALRMLGPKPVLKHVVDSCAYSANYLNKLTHKTMTSVGVALLIPEHDPIGEHYLFRNVQFVRGSERTIRSFN